MELLRRLIGLPERYSTEPNLWVPIIVTKRTASNTFTLVKISLSVPLKTSAILLNNELFPVLSSAFCIHLIGTDAVIF